MSRNHALRIGIAKVAVVVGATLGCPDPSDEATPRIVLERASRSGVWSATYQMLEPVDALRFERRSTFRPQVWEVVTPGWSLIRDEDYVWLKASPGAASETIVVEFPVYTEHIPKDYEFFQRFTDGSVAVYTGHLYVTADPAEIPEQEATYLRRVEFVPRDDERLIIHGETFRGRTAWDDPFGDGTYAYLGTIDPLETDEMISILDPGAPPWLLDRLTRLLPTMFELYSNRFDEPLPWKPTVIFSFVDLEMPGRSSGGGTLTGLVQMSATGRDWYDASPQSAESLLYLIAHEAAHFWNGQIHPYVDSADSWMHEGSADAFAELILRQTDYIDDDRLAERRSEALDHCASGLRDGSLEGSLDRRTFDNYYACGDLIAVWSVASIDRPERFHRLFDVWRTVFAGSDGEDGSYDRTTYLDALRELGAEPDTVELLERFVRTHHTDPVAALTDFMGSVGITLESRDRPLRVVRRARAVHVIESLMSDQCDGRYSFFKEGTRVRTAAIEDCEPFSRELRIVSIEGYEIEEDGDRALAAVIDRCRQGSEVRFGLEDGVTVEIPCNRVPREDLPAIAFPTIPTSTGDVPSLGRDG